LAVIEIQIWKRNILLHNYTLRPMLFRRSKLISPRMKCILCFISTGTNEVRVAESESVVRFEKSLVDSL
jgi:hypothetical protein